MRDNRITEFNNLVKVVKRIAITMLACIPICIIFGYFTQNIIKSNALQVVCFMLIMGLGVLIVEIVARKKEKKRKEEVVETKKDVFRWYKI